MAIILSDNFDRADSTNVIGSPQTGGPWTVRSGTWGISSNQAYTSATAVQAMVTAPGAVDLLIQAKFGNVAGNGGVVARWLDSNNWVAYVRNSTNLRMYTKRAGTLLSIDVAKTVSAGDVIGLVAKGRDLYGLLNGVIISWSSDQTYGNGATAAGLMIDNTTALKLAEVSADDAPVLPVAPALVRDDRLAAILPNSAWVMKGRTSKSLDTTGAP